jgi:ADP-ribose pyrophosphatase YjhB (NUDIX family)
MSCESFAYSEHIDMADYMLLCDTLRLRHNEGIIDAARRVVAEECGAAVGCARKLLDLVERDSSADGQWLAIAAAAKLARDSRPLVRLARKMRLI